jgi:hypothetical protein
MKASHLLASVTVLTLAAVPAMCSSALFTSVAPNPSNGSQPLDATALFSLTGNQLTIEVTNKATGNPQAYVDSDVLTGLYFSSAPVNLTPESATAARMVDPAGNNVCLANCDAGDGWEYRALGVGDGILTNGIFAVQTPKFLFSNFGATSTKLGGTGYAIVPGDYSNAHGSSLADPVYSAGSATFTMMVPNAFTLATIDHITFVWGTSANDPFQSANLTFFDPLDAPEPSTWILIPAGMALVLTLRRRSLHSTKR